MLVKPRRFELLTSCCKDACRSCPSCEHTAHGAGLASRKSPLFPVVSHPIGHATGTTLFSLRRSSALRRAPRMGTTCRRRSGTTPGMLDSTEGRHTTLELAPGPPPSSS